MTRLEQFAGNTVFCGYHTSSCDIPTAATAARTAAAAAAAAVAAAAAAAAGGADITHLKPVATSTYGVNVSGIYSFKENKQRNETQSIGQIHDRCAQGAGSNAYWNAFADAVGQPTDACLRQKLIADRRGLTQYSQGWKRAVGLQLLPVPIDAVQVEMLWIAPKVHFQAA